VENDAARERVADVLSGLQDQLSAIAAAQKEQAALQVAAQTADGAIEVTVNAQGQLINTVIDKDYLDEHDFEELADHITAAAQAAARDAGQRVAQILAPINERHQKFSSFLDTVEKGLDFQDLVPPGLEGLVGMPRRSGPDAPGTGGSYDHGGEADFPRVRR
jgi:DNA-binding protein YbaB